MGRTLEHSGAAVYPRALLAQLELGRDPQRALTLLEPADPEQAPALLWQASAAALEVAGQAERAAEVRARLVELYPTGVIEPAEFLLQAGLQQQALELVDGAVAAFPEHGELCSARATILNRLRRRCEALDALLALRAREPAQAPLALMARIAHALGDWETLAAVAEEDARDGGASPPRGAGTCGPAWRRRRGRASPRVTPDRGAASRVRSEMLVVLGRLLLALERSEAALESTTTALRTLRAVVEGGHRQSEMDLVKGLRAHAAPSSGPAPGTRP
ncbi:MAG: hypothetical protein AB7N76_25455 [Planctomycetota bacterium]